MWKRSILDTTTPIYFIKFYFMSSTKPKIGMEHEVHEGVAIALLISTLNFHPSKPSVSIHFFVESYHYLEQSVH